MPDHITGEAQGEKSANEQPTKQSCRLISSHPTPSVRLLRKWDVVRLHVPLFVLLLFLPNGTHNGLKKCENAYEALAWLRGLD